MMTLKSEGDKVYRPRGKGSYSAKALGQSLPNEGEDIREDAALESERPHHAELHRPERRSFTLK